MTIQLPITIVKFYVDPTDQSQSGFYFYSEQGGSYVRQSSADGSELFGNDNTFEIDSETRAGETYNGLGGADTYVIRASLDKNITISDAQTGSSDGSEVKNKIVFDTDVTVTGIESITISGASAPIEIRITLSTGAVITVSGPENYNYQVKGVDVGLTQFLTDFSGGFVPDNVAPVFGAGPFIFDIDENADGSTTPVAIGQVQATDSDIADSLTHSFISAVDQNGANVDGFIVDADGAIAYTGLGLDAETISAVTLTIRAFDGTEGVETAVTININDLNDVVPVITSDTLTISAFVDGTAVLASTVIYTASGTADVGSIEWSLTGDDAGLFSIDPSTGEVTFRSDTTPDHETKESYFFNVVATVGALTQTQAVTISVTDVSDNIPVFVNAGTSTVSANEGDTASVIFVGSATPDVDGSSVTYTITDGGTYVEVNENTGEVRLKTGVDREAMESFGFTIQASDGTNSASQTVTVTVGDVNDVAPVIATSSVIINEDQTEVTLSARDLSFTDGDETATDAASATYTIAALASGVSVTRDGSALGDGSSFTQADVDSGLVKLTINDDSSLSGLRLTVSDGVNSNPTEVDFSITQRVYYDVQAETATEPTASNTIDLSSSSENYEIDTGDNNDAITTSSGANYINAGLGNDRIVLDSNTGDSDTRGSDTVVYNFDAEGDVYTAKDGGDGIEGFKRGEDTFMLQTVGDSSNPQDIDSFLSGASGDADGVFDDLLVVTPNIDIAGDGDSGYVFSVTGLTFHFQEAGTYSNGRLANGFITIDFDEVLSWDAFLALIETDAGDVNFDYGRGHIKDLTVLPELMGEGSLGYEISVVVDDYGPVFTSGGSASVAEDIGDDATIYTAVAADADGDTVSYSITGGNDASVFEIDASTGEVSLVSGESLDAEGTSSYTLTITATSQARGEAAKAETLDVTITVTNVDEGDAVFTVTSDGDLNAAVTDDVLTVSLTVSDPDGDGAGSYTYQWQRDGSDISGATNAEYTVTADDEGTSLTVTVTYTDGGSTSESVTATPSVSVAAPVVVDDHGPVFTSGGSASIAEDIGEDATIYTAVAADADGDTVSYSITGGNDAGVFEIDSTTGEVSLISGQSLDAEGTSSYTLTITATSQAAGEAAKAETLDVTITVDNVDEGDAVFTVTSDGDLNAAVTDDVLTVSLTVSDPDGDGAGSYTYQWQRDGSDISGATNADYTITADDEGTSLTVTVTYTDGGSTSESVTATPSVSVATPVVVDDHGPVFTSGGSASIAEDIGEDATIYTAVAADADGDTVSYSITGGNDAGVFEIDSTTGEVSLVSGQSLDAEGTSSYTLTITATSQAAGEAAKAETLDVTITVTNVDEGDAVFTVTSDGDLNAAVTDDVLTVSLTVSDPDGDGAGSYTYQWQRDGSDISGATNADYTITADDEGTSLTVTVTYTDGGSTSESVTATPSVSVAAPVVVDDHGPVFTSGGSASIAEDIGEDATIYTAVAADADGDTVSYSITGGNDAGVFEIDSTTGEVSLISGQSLDAEGTSSYTLTITATSQAAGEAAKAETLDVTITVTNVDEGDAVFTVTSDGDLNAAVTDDVLTVSLTVSDPDGDGAGSYTYQWQRDGSDISGATNADYTITADDEGTSLTVTVTYTDGGSTSESVTATPSVSVAAPVVVDDHGPVFTSGGSASIAEDIGEDATIYTAVAADADGDTVSYSITGGNDAGVFEIDSTTGEVSLISGQSLDAEGVSSYTLTITATSQAAGEAAKAETLDVDITVTNVNDVAPVITSSATGDAVAENVEVDTSTVIYTAAGTFDVTPIVWSLKAGNSDDAALFSIDSTTGAVIFQSDTTPDFEVKDSYAFTVVATSGSLSAEQDVSIAVTNVDEGDAVYIIDDADSGLAEHIADATGLAVGSTLYARLSSDDPDGNGTPSYQWKRGGVDIASATAAAYVLTAADLGQALTVTVTYTDDSGEDERVDTATVNIPAAPAPVNDGQATFTITSDGETTAPAVGDELTVTPGNADPDGDGTFTYQWFVVGDADISGATGASYTIAETGQTIGVRVSYTDGDGFNEQVEVELGVASVEASSSTTAIIDPDAYAAFSGTNDPDTIDRSSETTAQLIQGGNKGDTITTSGEDDVVIGGYGSDTINLGGGAETIVYRLSTDGTWTAIDGSDTINDFDRGTDKLVLVDVGGTPMDYDDLVGGESRLIFKPLTNTDGTFIQGLQIVFNNPGFENGPGDGVNQGGTLTINWQSADYVRMFEDDYSSSPSDAANYLGVFDSGAFSFAGYDFDLDQITDFSLIENYFDADFDDGVRVIEASELGVDII